MSRQGTYGTRAYYHRHHAQAGRVCRAGCGQWNWDSAPHRQQVWVFLDLSNILHSARTAAPASDGPFAGTNVRVNAKRLYELAAERRDVREAVAVAGDNEAIRNLSRHFEAAGFTVQLNPRDQETGREVDVDETLQELMRGVLAANQAPGVLVLMTGDGRGFLEGTGFLPVVQQAHRMGWGVEVISWDCSCHHELRSWAADNGVYLMLDDYYEFVTFVENGRRANPNRWSQRPLARPTARAAASPMATAPTAQAAW